MLFLPPPSVQFQGRAELLDRDDPGAVETSGRSRWAGGPCRCTRSSPGGVPLGTAASDPFLNNSAIALQLPQGRAFDPVVAAAVPAALALLVVVAALVPGLRAGATDSVRAMVLGSAPSPGRRSLLSTALVRLRAPRPLSLGAGDAFARPVRGLLTLTVLVIGIATATFAIGLQDRFSTVLRTEAASYGYGQDVVVHRYPGLADNTLSAQLAQQPETRQVLGVETLTIRVSGLKDPIPIYALRGEAGAFGYRAQRGRWLVGPGEAVVSPAFANGAHLGIGDSFSGTLIGGPPLTLRVVGMQNDFNSVGGSIRISWATLTALLPGAVPDQYQVKLAPGSDAKAYAQRVGALYPDSVTAVATQIADVDVVTNLITGSVGFLALVLLAIAATGVFNATLLTMRERVREISVLKTVGMTSRQIAMMAVGSTLVLLVLASGVGVPFGIWLEGVIWNSMLSIFDVLVLPGPSQAALPLELALVAAFVFALLGAALPARWAAATPVAQVLRSE
jgi:putative ABC transport system permease protein